MAPTAYSTERVHLCKVATAKEYFDAITARYSTPSSAILARVVTPFIFHDLPAFFTVADLITRLRSLDFSLCAALTPAQLAGQAPHMHLTLHLLATRLPNRLSHAHNALLAMHPNDLTTDLVDTSFTKIVSRLRTIVATSAVPTATVEVISIAAPFGLMEEVQVLGRPIQFDTWLDDLQLYLLSDSKDSVSLFDLASGAATAPPATADSSTRSQWLTRDAAARLAICNHLPSAECAHFGQQWTTQALYDAVDARYPSPATAAPGCLLLPYLFPELSAFATVEDLVSHLHASDACYRAAVPAELLYRNPPPMYITLYFIVTRLPDSLRSVRDHFLSLEWFLRGSSGGSCLYVICTGDRAGQTCGRLHTQHRCFSRLDDAWRAGFGDDVELPRWANLLKSRIAIFDLDFDAILSAMYALSVSIAATALGASESGTLPGTAPTEALHTFTLDSGASRCLFRDSTILTPLPAPVPVRLADPSRGPVIARSSTVLSCLAVPSGSLSGLHLPSFSTNLVSTAALQDAMITTTTHGGVRVRSGSHLLLVSPLVAPESSLTPPLGSPLPATSSWHALSYPYLWSSQVSAYPSTLACPTFPPLRRGAASRERYFVLVVDDYTRYTMVFPLRSKGQVVDVLIPWIRTVRLQLRECFGQDLPVLRLLSDRGGELSSTLLRDFCRGEGILHSFTLPDSPQQNEIAERHIGSVMELNLWPRVSLPKTSPTLHWTREVGDALVFRVWGSRAFVRNTPADKLSPRAIPCVFLGFVPDAHGWQFYHPTSRRVLPSQDVTFDESVLFYHLFPYRSTPPTPPPLFLAPGPPPVDPLPPQGPAPSRVSQVDPPPGPAPVQLAVGSGAARGAAFGGAEPGGVGSEGAETGGAEPGGVGTGGAEPGGVEPEGVEPGGAASEGTESGGAEPQGAASSGGSAGASLRLSLQQLREWFVRRARLRSGAIGAGGAGGAGVVAGASSAGGAAATSPGGARTWGTGAAGTGDVESAGVVGPSARVAGATGAGAGGTGAADPCARGAGGTVRPRPYFVPLLQQKSGGLTERCEPASCPVSPVRTARRAPRSCPPPVPDTHAMALRPSSVPLRVPLPAPLESSLPEVPDPEFDRARAVSPTVSRVLATAVTNPSFESAIASDLVAELLDFAAACRLDYATALNAESASASPPSFGGECALGTDVLEDRQEDFECLAAAVPHFASMLLAPEGDLDAPDIPTPRSYVEAITVPSLGANIVNGMWIFRVKRPPSSPPAFKAHYVAQGFSQRQGVDYFQTFSPTPKMTTLRVLLHVAAQRDYEFHSLDFSTAFLQGSLHAPREWHDTLRTTLAAPGFAPSTADTSLFLRNDTSLPPFYVLVYVVDLVFATADTEALSCRRDIPTLTWVLQRFGFQFSSPQPTPLSTSHSLSAPPSDESVEPSGPYPELVGCLMYLMTCTRLDLAYPLSLLARYVAPGRHRKVHWDAAKRVLRYLCSTSGMGLVLGGRGPVVLTGHADAFWVDDSATQRSSQGCLWLTYLLTDLGEQPRSPPVLYVDKKAMIALSQEHRLEHRTKHITLRYFLARELQQCGQLCLAYAATRANTADVFTKALPPGDHQRFVTVLGLVPTLPYLLIA
ncbi:unnamed protein product [Closterium sp. NIES-53]